MIKKYAHQNHLFKNPWLWQGWRGFVWSFFLLPHLIFAQAEDEYETVKREILCQTIRFMIDENADSVQISRQVDCRTLESIEQTIPPDFSEAVFVFKMFKNKAYKSYGEGKIETRLNKLLKDLNTELNKVNRDRDWQENVNTLHVQLTETKTEILTKLKQGTYQKAETQTNLTANNKDTKPTNSTNFMSILITVLLFLLLAGGIAYLYWQNQQLQKQIGELEDQFQEKYSRLDNRIDTMTPIQDYKSLLLKFNFLNDQVNALIQEVMILKTRNEHKMSVKELVAKRTEYLEGYTYNPNLQIYYAKIRRDKGFFDPLEFKTEPSRDSIYKIEINLNNADQASFSVVTRNEFHQIALSNAPLMLAPACDYANEPYNDSRIVTLDNGLLEKRDMGWVIVKKAKIAFE
ncbi:MAG: hypothetical protein MUE85_19210 [Microscillaceae bacterium]|jgi:hypothetical protein|nr:hypothetical protein [Microscillaceae bacterium]